MLPLSIGVLTDDDLRALHDVMRDLDKSPSLDVVEPSGIALSVLTDDEGRAYTLPSAVLDEVVQIKKDRMLPRSLLSIARLYFGHTLQRYYPHGKAIEESADAILDILGHNDANARRRVVEILKVLDTTLAPF
jgi:hypothetical protein